MPHRSRPRRTGQPCPSQPRSTGVARFARCATEEARRAVSRFEGPLDEPLVPIPTYTAWVQFVGLTQHDLYHAGQIVLLKRALARQSPST